MGLGIGRMVYQGIEVGKNLESEKECDDKMMVIR